MEPRRVLITGGAGFIGSSLALRLREAFPRAEILCLDNLYRKGSELNRQRIETAGVAFVRGDVRDRQAFAMAACDLVIDAAAEPSVMAGSSGGDDVPYVVDTNLGGTLNVLEAARRWGAAVLFLSTSRVYPIGKLRAIRVREADTRFEIEGRQDIPGITADGISEAFPLDGARTLYGATKYASEIMVGEYAAQFGLKTLVNRCGVVAGPWQMGRVDQGFVALWVAAHHFGKPLKYIGYGGRQVRDLLHVQDLIDLVLLQVAKREDWDGSVFNVGGGREVSVSLLEMTELARAATGRRVAMDRDDRVREGDVPLYITDAGKVRRRWNWSPTRSESVIVEDVSRWVRDHEDILRPVLAG